MTRWAIRHSRYYVAVTKAILMQFMEYRTEFFMLILSSYTYNIVALSFLFVIFEQTDSVAGWNRNEMILLHGIGQLVFYIYYAFLSSIEKLGPNIASGKIDEYLTKPISPVVNLSTRKFGVLTDFPHTLLAIAIIAYALIQLKTPMTPLNILSLFLIPMSALFLATIKFAVGTLAFWLTDVSEIDAFTGNLINFMKYPIDIFPKTVSLMFKTILPSGLLAYVPAHFLAKGFNQNLMLFYTITFVVFILATSVLWSRGQKAYSSVSS